MSYTPHREGKDKATGKTIISLQLPFMTSICHWCGNPAAETGIYLYGLEASNGQIQWADEYLCSYRCFCRYRDTHQVPELLATDSL